MRVAAIVPSAGTGARLKSRIQKPYITLGDKPILARTLIALSKNKNIAEILVSVGKDKLNKARRYPLPDNLFRLACGILSALPS